MRRPILFLSPRWEVRVERVLRLRVSTEWTLGPYRFHWVARLVKWASHIDAPNVWQTATIRRVP